MNTLDLIAYKRPFHKKSNLKAKRRAGLVPCVVYGYKRANQPIYVPLALFRALTHTPSLHFVRLDIEGDCLDCILQATQYHPVSGVLVHADFLVLDSARSIKMNVPVRTEGTPEGVIQGGKLMMRKRNLRVMALPSAMPEVLVLDVSHLALGELLRVSDIETGDYTILEQSHTPILSVQVPRVAKLAEVSTVAQEEGEAAPTDDAEGASAAGSKEES